MLLHFQYVIELLCFLTLFSSPQNKHEHQNICTESINNVNDFFVPSECLVLFAWTSSSYNSNIFLATIVTWRIQERINKLCLKLFWIDQNFLFENAEWNLRSFLYFVSEPNNFISNKWKWVKVIKQRLLLVSWDTVAQWGKSKINVKSSSVFTEAYCMSEGLKNWHQKVLWMDQQVIAIKHCLGE